QRQERMAYASTVVTRRAARYAGLAAENAARSCDQSTPCRNSTSSPAARSTPIESCSFCLRVKRDPPRNLSLARDDRQTRSLTPIEGGGRSPLTLNPLAPRFASPVDCRPSREPHTNVGSKQPGDLMPTVDREPLLESK